jgi:hypothetical protein
MTPRNGPNRSTLLRPHRKFGWTTANKDLFMIGNEKDIMIGGGGGCGIWLDRYHTIQTLP